MTTKILLSKPIPMSSIYPDHILRTVLNELDPLDVLEFIDYHPESMQRDRGKIRCYCPIHRETVFRTLVLDEATKTFKCSKPDCAGQAGGDLISLAAKSLRVDFDSVLRRLVEEFNIDVNLPENQEAVNRALVEAENYVDLAIMDYERRDTHMEEAQKRIERVLDEDPTNLPALRAEVRMLEGTKRYDGMGHWVHLLAEAELKAENFDKFVELAEKELAREGENLPLRKLLAYYLADQNLVERSVDHLMTLADQAEVAGEYAMAIDAYRRIESLGETGIDVTPMVAQLLVMLDQSKEAVKELLHQAENHREKGELDEAVSVLENALSLQPDSTEAVLELIRTQIHRGIQREEYMSALRLIDEMVERGDWKGTVEALNQLAGVHPDDAIVIERLVAAHHELGDTKMLRIMQNRLVELYYRENDLTAARLILDDLLTAEPENKSALLRYADIAREEGNLEAAITHYRTLEQVYEKEQNFDDAIATFRKLINIQPDNIRNISAFVSLLNRIDRHEDATKILSECIATMKKTGNMIGLKDILLQSLKHAPDNADFLLEYAAALEKMGEPESAFMQRMKACQILIRTRHFAPAEKTLRQILSEDEGNAVARELLASSLEGQGKKREAVRELKKLTDHLFEIKEYGFCRKVLEKLLDMDPQRVETLEKLVVTSTALNDRQSQILDHERLLMLYKSKRRYLDAIREGNAILDIDKDHVDTHREMLELYRLNGDATQWGRSSWELAEIYRTSGEIEEERKVLDHMLELRPRDFQVRERLMEYLREQKQTEELNVEVDEYLKLSEQEGRLDRATDYLRTFSTRFELDASFQKRLISLYEKVSRTEEQVDQMVSLIQLHEQEGETDEIIPLYRKLIEMKPAEVKYRRRLADLLLDSGHQEESIQASLDLAALHMRHHRYEDAQTIYAHIVHHDRENVIAYHGLAQLYKALGLKVEAIENLKEVALLHARKGEFNDAEKMLKEAFEIEAESPTVQRQLANLFLDENNRDEERAIKELLTLADYYDKRDNDDASTAARYEAIELKPRDFDVRKKAAKGFAARKHHNKAVDVMLELAEFHRAEKDFDEALRVCEAGMKFDTNNLKARSLRAQIYEESGDTQKALEEWRALAPLLSGAAASTPIPVVPVSPSPVSEEVYVGSKLMILPEYNFEHFVVGDRNRFAWATAMAVAKSPGKTPHNPLFLYSDVGMGKTHILHAIANYQYQQRTDCRIVYTNAEDFTTELIDAIQHNKIAEFRQKHKSSDLLLIDDVHFLAGKEVAQEEFFHIFNTLFQAKKQIVVTSDRPPKDIAHLENRLKSRFGAGVIVDIQPPEVETRAAILRREVEERLKESVPDDVLLMIAEAIDTNIRDLKAAFNQLVLMHEVGEHELSTETARKVIDQLTTSRT